MVRRKIGNKGLVKPSNDEYGIGKREYITNVNKSQNLAKLSEIDKSKLSENVALSLQLQQEFGLRREESMKFQAAYALGGHSPQTAEKSQLKQVGQRVADLEKYQLLMISKGLCLRKSLYAVVVGQ